MTLSTFPDAICLSLRQQWLFVNRPRTFTAWLRERYGDMLPVNFQGLLGVIVLTPEGARQVLSADPAGYDAFWKKGFAGLQGPGSLLVLGGDAQRRERRLLAPAFHHQSFFEHGGTIRTVTRLHTKKWQPGLILRAIDTTLEITLDVIMRLVFGVEERDLTCEGREVLSTLLRAYHPLIVFFPFLQSRWFPLWRRYDRAKGDFADWMSRYLAERRAQGGEAVDVLGRMLAASYEDGSPMRDADVQDELMTILLAGHYSTAVALAWALYELGRHPAVLEKLRAELEALGTDPDTGSIAKLPYLGAVCNETLRLRTIQPEVARVALAPLSILGHTIPAGHSVVVSIMAIHHDPAVYPEPDRFIPERFIERTYSPFEFLPFGGGHRRCLGAALSDYEMRIALAEIVMHWEFEPTATEREIRRDIAMGPKNGVRVRIKGRRRPGQVVTHSAAQEDLLHA